MDNPELIEDQMVLAQSGVQTVRISQAFKEFVKDKKQRIFSIILRRMFCG